MFDVVENISENLMIDVIAGPEIGADAAWVEEVWNSALVTRPWLIDEDIFNVSGIKNGTLRGHFVPYRYYVAQQEGTSQRLEPRIKPLAVTGITKTIDGMTLLAKRGFDVYQDAGLWELAPCGGVTSRSLQINGNLNYYQALDEEFIEELGISERFVESKKITGLIIDKTSSVHELLVKVSLSLTSAEAIRCFSGRESSEYSEVMFIGDDSDISKLTLGALSRFVLLQEV
jgi:hypothetical protein